MQRLAMICPKTNKETETGIETDYASLARARTARLKVRCARCGGLHEIVAENAYFSPVFPLPARAPIARAPGS